MITRNYMKEKLEQGHPVLGTWNTLGSTRVTEVLAQAKLDFMLMDFEHGPVCPDTLVNHVNAAESANCSPWVRLPEPIEWMAQQSLDSGCHGLLIAHTDTLETAKKAIQISKYPPRGNRGYSPFSKAGGFTNKNRKHYSQQANAFNMLGLIVESITGIENLPTLLTLPEIDVIYFGAFDLSQSLGDPGNMKNPKLRQTIKDAAQLVLRAGKVPGGFVAQSWDDIRDQTEMGLRFMTYDVDASILYRSTREITDRFHTELCGGQNTQ